MSVIRFTGISPVNLTSVQAEQFSLACARLLSANLLLFISPNAVNITQVLSGSVVVYFTVTVPQLRATAAYLALKNYTQLLDFLLLQDPIFYASVSLTELVCRPLFYFSTDISFAGANFPVQYCLPQSICNTAMTYEYFPPTPTSDRICSPLRNCSIQTEYILVPSTPTSDRICQNLTVCNSLYSYEFHLPTLTTDRQCSNYTSDTSVPMNFAVSGNGGFLASSSVVYPQQASQSAILFNNVVPGSNITASVSLGTHISTQSVTIAPRLAITVSAYMQSPSVLWVDEANVIVLLQVKDVSHNLQTLPSAVAIAIETSAMQPLEGQCTTDTLTGRCQIRLAVPNFWFQEGVDTNAFVYYGFAGDATSSALQAVVLKGTPSMLTASLSSLQSDIGFQLPLQSLFPGSLFSVPVYGNAGAWPINSFQLKFDAGMDLFLTRIDYDTTQWAGSTAISEDGLHAAFVATPANPDSQLNASSSTTLLCTAWFLVNISDVAAFSSAPFKNLSLDIQVLSFFDMQNGEPRSTPFYAQSADRSGIHRGTGVVAVEADSLLSLVPTVSQGELINTAVLTGHMVQSAVAIFATTSSGKLINLPTGSVSCASRLPSALKADLSCTFVFLDGTESTSADQVQIIVSFLPDSLLFPGTASLPDASFTLRVWFPRYPLTLVASQTMLSRISGLLSSTPILPPSSSSIGSGEGEIGMGNQSSALPCEERYSISTIYLSVSFGYSSTFASVRVPNVTFATTDPNVAFISSIRPDGMADVEGVSPGSVLIYLKRLGPQFGNVSIVVSNSSVMIDHILVNTIQSVSLAQLPSTIVASQTLQLQGSWRRTMTVQGAVADVIASLLLSDGSIMRVEPSSFNLEFTSLDTLVIGTAQSLTSNTSFGPVSSPSLPTSPWFVTATGTGSGYLLRARLYGDAACGAPLVSTDYGYVSVNLPPPQNISVSLTSPRLALPSSSVAHYGLLPINTTISVKLVYSGDRIVDMTTDPRTVYDAVSGNPQGIFSVSKLKNGSVIVSASGTAAGEATLVISFTHINFSTSVEIVVVDTSGLNITPHPLPSFPLSSLFTTTTLSPIANTGVWEKVSFAALLLLTDGSTLDVSEHAGIMFSSQPSDVLNFGTVSSTSSSSANLNIYSNTLFVNEATPIGVYAGNVSVFATFSSNSQQSSPAVNLLISNIAVQILNVSNIIFPSTLNGTFGSSYFLSFSAILTDGTVLPSNYLFPPPANTLAIPDLFIFTSSNPSAVAIDSSTGRMYLLENSPRQESIYISSFGGTGPLARTPISIGFYANLNPLVGDVDLGEVTGPPIAPVLQGDTFTVPIRVNVGSASLRSIQLQIVFDYTLLSFVTVSTGHDWPGGPFDYNIDGSGSIQLGGAPNGISGIPTLATVTFQTIKAGVAGISGQVITLGDSNGDTIGSLNAFVAGNVTVIINNKAAQPFRRNSLDTLALHPRIPSEIQDSHSDAVLLSNNLARLRRSTEFACLQSPCTACSPYRQLGDIDGNCIFDIRDVSALRDYLNLFALNPPPFTFHELFPGQLSAMDVDRNGEINSQDVDFLMRVAFSKVRFLQTLTAEETATPTCLTQLRVRLITAIPIAGDQPSNASDTIVYFWLQVARSSQKNVSVTGDAYAFVADPSLGSAVTLGVVESTSVGVIMKASPLGNGTWGVDIANGLADVELGVSVLAFTVDALGETNLIRSSFFFGAPSPQLLFDMPLSLSLFVTAASAVPLSIQGSNPFALLNVSQTSLDCQSSKPCEPIVQYIAVPATSTSPPVCANATICQPHVSYELMPPTLTSDRVCSICSHCDSSYQYVFSNCSSTVDTSCRSLTTCTPTRQFQKVAPTLYSDRQCAVCTVCSSDTYASSGCDGIIDSQCTAKQTCSSSQFMVSDGTATTDRKCADITDCVPGSTYELVADTPTSNRICGACSSCNSGDFIGRACGGVSDTLCVQCSSCKPGVEYIQTACSVSNDTLCKSCTSCVAGSTFQSSPCQAQSDAVCSSCSVCESYQYTVGSCNTLQDTQCKNYTLCDYAKQYQLSPPTPFADRICDNLAICNSVTQYVLADPTSTSNRLCGTYTTCSPGVQYESVAATATSDRICQFYSQCHAQLQYQTQSATPTSDRVCTWITNCSLGSQFELIAPTPTSDRLCQTITTCNATFQFEVASPTPTSDRLCSSLLVCPPVSYFQSVAPSATSNRQCSPLTTCQTATQYEITQPTLTSDRQCGAISDCNYLVQFQMQAPTPSSDRVCQNAAVCISGKEYMASQLTSTSNRICRPYTTCRTGPSAQLQSICTGCALAIDGTLPVTPACSNLLISACSSDGSLSYCPTCNAQPPNLDNINDPCLTVRREVQMWRGRKKGDERGTNCQR